MKELIEQLDLDLLRAEKCALEEECAVSPLGTCVSRCCHWEPHSRAFTIVSASKCTRKNGWATSGTSSSPIWTNNHPILHLHISIILGGVNKNKESPLIQEQVEMETILSGVVPGPAVPTLLWNSAHCFLTKRAKWSFWSPESFLSDSSADFSTELIVNTQPDFSRLSAYRTEAFPGAVCLDSDLSSLQPGWETRGRRNGEKNPSQEPQ